MRAFDRVNYRACHREVLAAMAAAPVVRTETWQSVATRPEMATYELEDVVLSFPVGTTDLDYHRSMIGPNLPWADRHFELDRASGKPLNPGETWTEWPWSNRAASFREDFGLGGEPQFNHTYAERYWPKWAGIFPNGATADEADPPVWCPHQGVRYRYGDLGDLVELLVAQPHTRAAYLPVWFPEDTGIAHGGRVPCSIGYLFRMRDDRLSVFYQIRSCDVLRHMNDDVYLTVRLLLWVLDRLKERGGERWARVRPGAFTMAIGSLHLFVNDAKLVLGGAS